MTTCLDLLTQSLKATGVVGVGQTAMAEDINDAFLIMRQMMAQWQRRRWLIPSLQDIAMPGNSQISNPIGLAQYWNYPRPDKIQAAYIRLFPGGTPGPGPGSGSDFNSDFNTDFGPQNNSSGGGSSGDGLGLPVDYPLEQIFSYENYSRLALKSLNSFPYMFFYDEAFPYGNVFIWPVPSERYEVHLIVKSILSVPVNITDEMMIAPEYEEAIWSNLAVRLCISYQLSASKELIGIAKIALNTIKNANAQIPTLNMPTGLRNRSYNIFNDSMQ